MPELCEGDSVIEETHFRPLMLRARFAMLVGIFAIAVGYGIVLPMLPFLSASECMGNHDSKIVDAAGVN